MARRTAKNLDDLFKIIGEEVKESMEESVSTKIKQVEAEHVQSDVYDAYTGQDPYHERRGSLGGLADTSNMIHTVTSTVNGLELFVKNITKGNQNVYKTDPVDNNNYLAGIIEYGRDSGRYMTNKTGTQNQYLQPRPFISNSVQELSRTLEHVTELKKSLKRKGIQTD